jgi:hypothetical protein
VLKTFPQTTDANRSLWLDKKVYSSQFPDVWTSSDWPSFGGATNTKYSILNRLGPPGVLKRRSRSPERIGFQRRVCLGARGA